MCRQICRCTRSINQCIYQSTFRLMLLLLLHTNYIYIYIYVSVYTYMYVYIYMYIDWCCSYYFVRNSLVALLEALCARIIFFRFVNIVLSFNNVFLCARSQTKAFLPPLSASLLCLFVACLLCADCTCVLVCVCLCMSMCKCVGKVINI